MTLPLWSSQTTPEELLTCDGSAVLYTSFLAPDVADRMFADLQSEIPWTTHDLMLFGRQVTEPRLSSWIGDDGVSYRYSGRERTPTPWTPTLGELRRLCESRLSTVFNSVLANLYRSGADSMGWHADDEPELGSAPVIASLSFGAERRFDFRHRESKESVRVMLPHGSLLVMSGATQTHWMHRIARTTKVTTQRINLTFRHVFA